RAVAQGTHRVRRDTQDSPDLQRSNAHAAIAAANALCYEVTVWILRDRRGIDRHGHRTAHSDDRRWLVSGAGVAVRPALRPGCDRCDPRGAAYTGAGRH